MTKKEEIPAILRYERNRLRREMAKYADDNLSDPTGSYHVGILKGMSLAIQLLTQRIHELESGDDSTYN